MSLYFLFHQQCKIVLKSQPMWTERLNKTLIVKLNILFCTVVYQKPNQVDFRNKNNLVWNHIIWYKNDIFERLLFIYLYQYL